MVRVVRRGAELWHAIVPVLDDVTDIWLLYAASGKMDPFWWVCFSAMLIADVERVWFLVTLCLTFALLPLLWLVVWGVWFVKRCVCGGNDITPQRLGWWFARLNCTHEARPDTLHGRVVDTVLWTVLGSRARCSRIWSVVGLSGNAPKKAIHDSGVGFGAIDTWVARHPFRKLGMLCFGRGYKLKGEGGSVTRRSEVMVRAVGETLVVDPLFLVFSVVTGGWDEGLRGVAGISAVFSVLELLTELQYYVEESDAVLERASPGVVDSGISDTKAPSSTV